MTRRLAIGLLAMLYCLPGMAQPSTLLFHHLNVNNGLSQGVNYCLYKDSRGYVWISSFDGLNRYDGLSCTVFRENPADTYSIKGTLFLNIVEDARGNLWIGSNKGLNRYNRATNQFDHFPIPGRKPDDQLASPFYIDDKGAIWLQSGSTVLRFTPADTRFTTLSTFAVPGNLVIKPFPGKPFQSLQHIYTSVNNHPQAYAGLIAGDQITWTPLLGTDTTHGNLATVYPVAGGLWMGGQKGLFFYRDGKVPLSITAFEGQPLENVRSLAFDKKGLLRAGTSRDGLYCIDTTRAVVVGHYTASSKNPYALSGNQVQYVYTDAENQLWVCVWGKGVDYLSLEKFRFHHFLTREEAEEDSLNNFIRGMVESNNGQIWCGTQLSGILVLDKNKQVTGRITAGLPPAIEHLYKDSHGRIWISTFAGLFVADAATQKVTPVVAMGLRDPSRQFNFVTETANGRLLASTNAGLYLLDEKASTWTVRLVKGLPDHEVFLTSYCAPSGWVYVSRPYKGFSVGHLQGDSFVVQLHFPYQASIKCFNATNDSTLWIGSTIGLLQLNTRKMVVQHLYTTHDGLSNQYIYGVLPDKDLLWLSTNAGINYLRPADGAIRHFNAGDGLQSNEFNTYAFCRLASGELLFGGVNGLNAFYPSAISSYAYRPRLQLSDLLVNDASFSPEINPGELHALSLAPSDNTVSVQFTVLDFANPASNRLYYILEGYDKNWIEAANRSVIRYANLPAGHYVLKAKAINAENVESGALYTLPISIAKPWWQQWWAKIVLSLLVAALLYMLVRLYLERKLRQQKIIMEKELAIEQERTKMARELHDGLGSKLSGIKHSFAAFKQSAHLQGNQEEAFDQQIDKLNESILELRNLSHSLSSELSLQHGLTYALRDYCNSLRESGVLSVVFNNLHAEEVTLTAEQSFHVFRIVQELLQNVIRHAHAQSAIVQLSFHHEKLWLTVEDDGAGFDSNAKGGQGIGLSNIQARIKLLQGKIQFHSVPGQGTTVDIEIPVT